MAMSRPEPVAGKTEQARLQPSTGGGSGLGDLRSQESLKQVAEPSPGAGPQSEPLQASALHMKIEDK